MTLTLYVLTGLPGSGKSWHAREVVQVAGAAHVEMDHEVVARGLSLVDYEARFALQSSVEARIPELLSRGTSVVAEFGSWTRAERDRLRLLGAESGARTELHFVDAPLAVCRERILARGGMGAEDLAGAVLDSSRELFERPSDDEATQYDAFAHIGVTAP